MEKTFGEAVPTRAKDGQYRTGDPNTERKKLQSEAGVLIETQVFKFSKSCHAATPYPPTEPWLYGYVGFSRGRRDDNKIVSRY